MLKTSYHIIFLFLFFISFDLFSMEGLKKVESKRTKESNLLERILFLNFTKEKKKTNNDFFKSENKLFKKLGEDKFAEVDCIKKWKKKNGWDNFKKWEKSPQFRGLGVKKIVLE